MQNPYKPAKCRLPDLFGQLFKVGVPSRVLLLRVPHHIGDMKRDPSLENYPYETRQNHVDSESPALQALLAPEMRAQAVFLLPLGAYRRFPGALVLGGLGFRVYRV